MPVNGGGGATRGLLASCLSPWEGALWHSLVGHCVVVTAVAFVSQKQRTYYRQPLSPHPHTRAHALPKYPTPPSNLLSPVRMRMCVGRLPPSQQLGAAGRLQPRCVRSAALDPTAPPTNRGVLRAAGTGSGGSAHFVLPDNAQAMNLPSSRFCSEDGGGGCGVLWCVALCAHPIPAVVRGPPPSLA
jgi:hypothetical protein